MAIQNQIRHGEENAPKHMFYFYVSECTDGKLKAVNVL